MEAFSGNGESTQTHLICFDRFDVEQDVFELKYGSGNNSMEISVNLINRGVSKKLHFGKNANLDSTVIDENNLSCREDQEITNVIRIQNGTIIESECVGK